MGVVVTEANASERLGAIIALSEECCDAKALELALFHHSRQRKSKQYYVFH